MTRLQDWLSEQFSDLCEIREIGQGGQKKVLCCEHPDYGTCVLKLIRPSAATYLDREIEAVARLTELESENVPIIYKVGRVDFPLGPRLYLVEQYIAGDDLSDVLAQGPLDKEQVLSLAVDLVTAAADAESVQVVHRDIKPGNIRIDGDGRAWLLDFGIARVLDLDSRTPSSALVGPHSPGYSAPEQFRYRKHDIDGRSDLFAIGVVIYECVTGANPFLTGASDKAEVLMRVEKRPLPRLSAYWDSSGALADFVSSLTQKHPHQRPRSCEEALEWLREVVTELAGG
jgi:serine/threonine-protein kinase